MCDTESIPLPDPPEPDPAALTNAPSEVLYTRTWSSCKLPTNLNVGLKGVAFILISMPLNNLDISYRYIQLY